MLSRRFRRTCPELVEGLAQIFPLKSASTCVTFDYFLDISKLYICYAIDQVTNVTKKRGSEPQINAELVLSLAKD